MGEIRCSKGSLDDRHIIIEDCICEKCRKITPHIIVLLHRQRFTVELRYICLSMYCDYRYDQRLPNNVYLKLGSRK